MTNSQRIAVIIPAYNVAPYVGTTLASVLGQTHGNLVVHVVDDGSTDETAAVVEGFADPRVRLYRQRNLGVAGARNRGLAEVWADPEASDALFFLDADDWLAPDALERLLGVLRDNPASVAAYGPFADMKQDDRPGDPPRRFGHGPGRSGDVLEVLLRHNSFRVGAVMVRATAARAVGEFKALSLGEDWDYWVRLALRGPFARLASGAPVFFYRRRERGLYRSQARSPSLQFRKIETVFADPGLRERVAPAALGRARARAERQVFRTLARGSIQHGEFARGRRFLRKALGRSPSVSDMVHLGIALLSPSFLSRLVPAFRPPEA